MLKVYFNTVIPCSDRKKVINAFKDLGFTFDRIFKQGSDVSHFVFRGRLPSIDGDFSMQFANFYFDEESKKQFRMADVSWIEIYLNFEKKNGEKKL